MKPVNLCKRIIFSWILNAEVIEVMEAPQIQYTFCLGLKVMKVRDRSLFMAGGGTEEKRVG